MTKYKCLSYNKNYSDELDKKFKNTFKFSDNDTKRFILLLRKGACSYGYMYEWEKLNEISFPEKEDYYSHLNMEDVTDADYKHAVCKDFEINDFGKYHNLHLKSNTLLLAFIGLWIEVFENIRKMCLLSPGLVSQAGLQKTEVKL